MKRLICMLLIAIIIMGVCSYSLACPIHGATYDEIDMSSTAYWAHNSLYHYMQNEYYLVCSLCGRETTISESPILKVHRWSGNRCIDCDYIR